MHALKLIQALEQLQHEGQQYFIEWVDIGEQYTYQIVINCTKTKFKYLRDVLNKDYALNVPIVYINDKAVIDTDISVDW